MRDFLVLIAALLLAGGALAQAQVYRWTDASGRVHYSNDKPPGGVRATTVESRISSYSGAPQVSRVPQAAKAPDAAAMHVTLYATDWCRYCARAREYFAKNGIRYVEHDIEKSEVANAEYKRLGGRGVPLILVGAQKMTGFSEKSMDQLLKSAGK